MASTVQHAQLEALRSPDLADDCNAFEARHVCAMLCMLPGHIVVEALAGVK